LHNNANDYTTFGELNGSVYKRTEVIFLALSGARLETHLSKNIQHDMWEKWALIAAGADITCLMRGTSGDITTAGASNYATALFHECCAIAEANGFAPNQSSIERLQAFFTPGSPAMSSMAQDIERGAPIEADHIVGDFIERGKAHQCNCQLLRIVYAHLKTYEARRLREQRSADQLA
jgi:2-dehydropantoate 2-reductase